MEYRETLKNIFIFNIQLEYFYFSSMLDKLRENKK